MSSMRTIWLLPVCLLAIAAFAGWLTFVASGFSALHSGILALTVFCSVAVIMLYGWIIWRTRQTERKLEQSLLLENEILSRLQADDSRTNTETADIRRRLGSLERRFDEAETRSDPHISAISAGTQGQLPQSDVVFDDKVVPLNNAGRAKESSSQTNAAISRRKIARLLDEGRYFFRMQPIINPLNKRLVGLEAFAFCILEDEVVAMDKFIGKVPAERQSRINGRLIKGIARLLRQLEKDDSLVPVHFELFLPPDGGNGSGDDEWGALLQTIQADAMLQKYLLPVLTDRRLLQGENSASDNLLALREVGLQICLADSGSVRDITEDVRTRHFSSIKLSANDLLRYRRSERERVADQLLPEMDRRGIAVFVMNVDQPHQASQLIDLDIAGAQGQTIGPMRALRMYADIDPLAHKDQTDTALPSA